MSTGGPILFYVQHLLGIGHVKRAAALARGMGEAGLDVHVAFGGMPVALAGFGAVQVHQLPPVRAADSGFSGLVDENDQPITPKWQEHRRRALLQLHDRVRPQLVLVEHFPFGRRKFRFELLPLAQKAAGRAVFACSVRGVLVARTDEKRNREIVELARGMFDVILVHGDPDVIPFDATFPLARELADRIRYTGYVAETRPSRAAGTDGHGEIIVSVGGGAVGEGLLRLALAARAAEPALGRYRWRLLAGDNLPERVLDELVRMAQDGVTVERARPDFTALLGRAALSISQGGYNTVMDILGAGCPALIVPFAEGGESEQGFRAREFARRGLFQVIDADGLSPRRLADAALAAMQAHKRQPAKINLDGVATTARLVAGMINAGEVSS
ncbi:MAG TPA: glycosyl transferase [Rhodobacteraceae bacterium]|nr:glycosyl transferase [Paracoccaceae bacterium]